MKDPGCYCPTDIPDWHKQDIDLGGQCVLTLSIPTLFHMPIAYEIYPQRQQQEIEQLQLKERWKGLVLTQTGMFRGRILRLIEHSDSPSHHINYLPSPFMLRGFLHHGNISTIRPSVREIQMALLDSGSLPKELYLCYLTCPHCCEEKGGDKILLLRRWETSGSLTKKVMGKKNG